MDKLTSGNVKFTLLFKSYLCNRCELYDRENVVFIHTFVISITW